MGMIKSFRSWLVPAIKRAAALSGLYHLPGPPAIENTPESLEKYSRKSDLVYACIEKKSAAAADPQLIVQRRNSEDEWETVEDHPLIALLECPNPSDTWETFIKAWTCAENVMDTFYCEIVRSRGGQVVGLYPLHPARVTEEWVTSRGGAKLERVRYTPGLGGYIEFRPDELMIRRRHGFASIYGNVSPLAAALGAVDADVALNDYVRAFFNNGGVPSGMLSFKDRSLSDEQAEQIQQRWTTRFGRGGSRRKGVAVMDKNAEYTPVGTNLDDMDSEVIRGQTETRICSVFGVPPILIGTYTALKFVNQRASYADAMEDFWQNTMRPELTSIKNYLTWTLLPEFESIENIRAKNIRVNWDFSEVQALQESEDAIHERARKDVDAGILTPNEARAKIGYDEIEGGDTLREPRSQMQLMPGEPEPKKFSAGPAPAKQLKAGDPLTIDGVPVGREMRHTESHVDLKQLEKDYETAKAEILALLLALRRSMAERAAALLEADPDRLDFPADVSKETQRKLKAAIKNAIESGYGEILTELGIPRPVTLDADDSNLADITRTVIGGFVAAITARIINEIIRWRLLGVETSQMVSQLPGEISGQSEKWIAADAGAASNAAIQTGRRTAIVDNNERWDILEYSALLDVNTCGPCEAADGRQASRLEDLPDTPNPDCEGGPRCRCFIVTIIV